MMTLLETMADVDSYLFLLSLLGPMFFKFVHKILVRCSPDFFGYACVILTYIAIRIH